MLLSIFGTFGTFSKEEKCDAAGLYIDVLKGLREYSSLTPRMKQALNQGRLGEVVEEAQTLIGPR